ncbi:MAG: hypothetical protein IT161_09570 [Bryobacterales bacterium]|nr:hypothetical protein [Bryobacterales bacterium]
MKRRVWTRNWPWKLASLAIAILAWMTFSGARELSMSVSVPLQYRSLPPDLDISSDMVEQVHLSLRGSANRLSRINPASMPIVIDLRGISSAGEHTFTVNEENLRLPAGVTVERVIPSQIRVQLEVRKRATVPVQVRFTAPPAGPVEVVPATLEIVGPESRVDRIRRVATDPIDTETLRSKGQVRTEAFSGDPQVRFEGSSEILVKMSENPSKDN